MPFHVVYSCSISSDEFEDFHARLQGAALMATKNALSIPTNVAFHRSVDSLLANDLDAFSTRVLSLTNDILRFVSVSDRNKLLRNKGKSKFTDVADVVDNFTSIAVDPVDLLFERVDICLDEFLGRRKPPAIAINPPKAVPAPKKRNLPQGWLDPALKHAAHLPKPQLSFKRKPDNTSGLHWYPSLMHKYNAKVPLSYNFFDVMENGTDHIPQTTHPYLYEIKNIEYPPWMFHAALPIPPKSFDETPFTWVSSSDEFSTMLDQLRNAREIAIDLEHHNYRTFAGFLCLMQISTRDQDWIVDALVLREELTELNEVFTNASIVKVLHGATSDILWLQQDFSLYIVNLFDTFHASKVLDFPRHGLVNLLEMYCDFTTDKRYQLADWRIRPLPEEMLLYARSDTHFLLYIYDNLRNALLDRGLSYAAAPQLTTISHETRVSKSDNDVPSHALIREVLTRSEETTLLTYEPPSYDAEGGTGLGGWESLLRRWNKSSLVEGPQKVLFLGVHAWRDRVAREEDESIRYVLPDHLLLRLVERLPADMTALNGLFHSVPPVVRKRAQELLDVIRENVRPSDESTVPAIYAPEMEGRSTHASATLSKEVQMNQLDIKSDALWSTASHVATKSSLFGSTLTITPEKPSELYSISGSALFGSLGGRTTTQTMTSSVNSSHFRAVVAKIHSTLVVAPSAPKILSQPAPSAPTEADVDVVTATDNQAEAATDEIPFIPASQRQSRPLVDDSIVTVGRMKQKKRKRPKTFTSTLKGTESVDTGSSRGSGVDVENATNNAVLHDLTTEEPFDFSSVPNILDGVPIDEEGIKPRKKKKQKGQGGVFGYGDYPAVPRAQREVKSGNQSYTFR